MSIRDWKWIVSILSGTIVFILSYKIWGKSGNLIEIISIGSGLVSIALAITAIIIAVAEGVKTNSKEQKVDNSLDSIISNLGNMRELINKLDTDNFKTHDKLSKLEDKFEDYRKYYNGSEEEKVTEVIPSEEKVTEVIPQEEKVTEIKQNPKTKNFIGITRADVYLVDFSSRIGLEQGGIRPVVVIQNEIANRFSPTVTVALITAQINKAKLPTHVELDGKQNNLQRDSVILLEQVRTIDKARFKEKITHLDDNTMKKVDLALLIQLDLVKT